jgi:hypothetical protein
MCVSVRQLPTTLRGPTRPTSRGERDERPLAARLASCRGAEGWCGGVVGASKEGGAARLLPAPLPAGLPLGGLLVALLGCFTLVSHNQLVLTFSPLVSVSVVQARVGRRAATSMVSHNQLVLTFSPLETAGDAGLMA